MKKELLKQKDALTTRLAGYAATAGAMMALAPNVNSQVVHSGIQNIQLNMPSDSIEIDLDTNGVMDFKFKIYGYSYLYTYGNYYYASAFGYAVMMNPKTDTYKNSWIDRMTSIISITSTNSQTYQTTNQYPIVDALPASTTVNSAQSLWTNISYPSYTGALGFGAIYRYYYGPSYQFYSVWGYGDFFEETGFIGVRFYIGTEQHYGWIRIRLGEYIDPVTIIDWAYETTPGVGIHVGEGGDITPPVATLDAGVSVTEEQTLTVQVSFDKEISDLTLEDFEVTNGTATNLVEITAGTEYTIDIMAEHVGSVLVTLPEGSALDQSGNANEMAFTTWEYIPDQTPPVTTLNAGVSETEEQTITVTISFDKEISGLGIDDFEISNGSASNLSVITSRTEFTIEVTAEAPGTVQVTLPEGSVETDAGTGNEVAVVSWTYVITGLNNTQDLSYKIFPNPADNQLHLEFEEIVDITIYNSTGRAVIQRNGIINESLDVSHLTPGFYILHIRSDKQTIKEKILIN